MSTVAAEKIRPQGGFVLLERDEAPETTASGLWRPTQGPEKLRYETGKVLACGPGYHDERDEWHPMPVAVGDRVVCEYGGAHPVPGEPRLALVSSAYLLGVLE